MSTKTYYEPSLTGSIPGLVPALFFGGFSALVIGLSYSMFMFWCPIRRAVYIAIVLFPVITGLVSRTGVSVGKIQSPELAVLVGIVNGLLAVYFSWVTFLYLVTSVFGTTNQIIVNVNDLIPKIQELAQRGGRGFGETVSYVMWAAEAGVVIIASAWMAIPKSHPFCRKCRKWCDERPCSPRFELPEDYEGTKASLENGDLTPLFTSARYAISNDPCLQATVYSCPNCERSTWLKVDIVELLGIDGSKLQTRTHPLFEYVAIPRDQAERLLDPPYRQDFQPTLQVT